MHDPIERSTALRPAATLNRQVDLELTLDQLWSFVGTEKGLQDWLGDDVSVAVRPGAVGTVTDDGFTRQILVNHVAVNRRLEFCWWPAGHLAEISTVVFDVVAVTPERSRLVITETLPCTTANRLANAGAERWEVRMLSLWACTVAMALVP